MKYSDDLFQLIHALSKNEKGYFKKYAAKHVLHGQNNYILLFDSIEAQKNYDEEKLKHVFRKKTFINHLPSEKNYLYWMIIRCLNEYHSEISAEARLKDLLHTLEILYDKGLFKQCDKILQKAKQLAIEFEKPLIELELHDWESRICITLGDFERLSNHLKQNDKRKSVLMEGIKTTMKLRQMEEKMLVLSKRIGFPRDKNEKQQYQKIVNHELLQNEDAINTFRDRFHYHTIFNIYWEVMGDQQKTYQHRKKLIDHAERFPKLLKDEQVRYVIAMNNLLNSQDELRKHDDFKVDLQKLRSINSRSPNIQARIFAYSYNLELTQLQIAGEFQKSILRFPEVEEGIKKFRSVLHKEFLVAFHYQFFYAHFAVGDYSKALRWMNQLIDHDSIKVRQEIYFFSRIMVLIIHYELKNVELLAYHIRSTYRFFLKRKRLFKFETIMLTFIKESAKFDTQKEFREGFEKLKLQLEKLKKDPYEAQVLSFFDLITWLESKITKRSFAQIVKEKVRPACR